MKKTHRLWCSALTAALLLGCGEPPSSSLAPDALGSIGDRHVSAVVSESPLGQATSTFTQFGVNTSHTPDESIDGNFFNLGWAIAEFDNRSGGGDPTHAQTAVFETVADINAAELEVRLHQNFGSGHLIGRFRLSVTSDDRATFADGLNNGGDVDANWTVLTGATVTLPPGLSHTTLGDGSILVAGAANAGTYVLWYSGAFLGITGLRLEVLEDPSLPFAGPGLQATNGNFVLSELVLLSGGTVIPDALVVQGFDDTRSLIGHVSGQSFSFVTGAPYALARSMVSGSFPNLQFRTGVSEVTPAAVAGADVFVVSPVRSELTDAEVCVLETFVNHGGALLEVRNLNARPPLLGTVVGPTSSQGFADVADLGSFLVSSGPFGPLGRIGTGFSFSFASIGDALVAFRSDAGPTVLELRPGAGRSGAAVLIGDEEVFMEGSFSGERAGHLPFNVFNQRLLLNTFAYFARFAPGLDPAADFSGCDPVQQIAIDVKPGGVPNSINARQNGVIPVAALSDAAFDATTIDWTTVRFGPGDAVEAHGRSHVEDVDSDGDMDMVFHFAAAAAGLACSDTQATLSGATTSGRRFAGHDAVRMVGCR